MELFCTQRSEGSHLPNCQTIARHAHSLNVLAFHQRNSLPLGPKRAFIQEGISKSRFPLFVKQYELGNLKINLQCQSTVFACKLLLLNIICSPLCIIKNSCFIFFWVAAIALWFHLRLPSCGPRFKSQAHHLCFFQFVLKL